MLSAWCLLCDDVAVSFDERRVQARYCILGTLLVRNAGSDAGQSVDADNLYSFGSYKGQAENLELTVGKGGSDSTQIRE